MQVLGITDGSAGMNAQVIALADAMGLAPEMIAVKVNPIWHVLPNALFFLHHLIPVTSQKLPNADLIISCGRKGALVSASLKTSAQRVHIQDPQMSTHHFDVVVAMEHDRMKGDNIITTPFALHNITAVKMAAEKSHWEPKFSHLPHPWNAVLIGGSTNKYRFTREAMQQLMKEIEAIPGSLLITSSRRTGEENITMLTHHFGGHAERAFLYTGELENPYPGMLACADKIYVTNDSVNMMSEALATGKTVSVLKLLGHQGTKPARFAETLHEKKQNPQTMMQEVALSVREMLARRA